jgi:hypothetical protein
VQGKVSQGKSEAARDIADRTAQPPDPSAAVEKPVRPLPPVPPTPALAPPNPSLLTPTRAPAEQTDLRAGECETNAMMAEASVTDQQLADSNESQFTEALAAKQAGEEHTATAPAEVRAAEARELAATTESARATGTSGVAAMGAANETGRSAVDTTRSDTSAADHDARAKLNADLRAVFTSAKQDVEKILSELDDKVARRFDDGEQQARAAFTADHTARMARYKDDRYAGVTGALKWVKDELLGLPAEANQLYQLSKQVYEQRMRTVIAGIADLVGAELARAKDRIAAGRRKVEDIVTNQKSAALKQEARKAAAGFDRDFAALESSVDAKQRSLADDVAGRYVAARNAIDEEIERLQEENEGLWDKAKDAVAGTVQTIMQLKDMLTGVLARAAGAVELIITAPVRFLGNLVGAVKGGVLAFGNNIWTHLKTGLKAWLLGNLAAAGLEIPERFDLPGILRMVLSILGLTWAAIRPRILAVIPEPVLRRLEQTLEIVKILVTEGLPGVWRWVLEKVGDIKEMVLGQIKQYVVESVIKAGIVWLVSLLNPASAFVKACKAIYDIVMFFVQRATQIKSFVDSVLDSIGAIARGGAGAVAGIVERSLAKALPVVIGFLASLLGLGGIPEKIRSVIDTVREPVGKAIDWVITTVVNAGKSLWSRMRAGTEKSGEDDPRDTAEKQEALDTAIAEGTVLIDNPNLTDDQVRKDLVPIRDRYGLTKLALATNREGLFAEKAQIVGEVNPKGAGPSRSRTVLPNEETRLEVRVGPPAERQGMEESLPRPKEVGLEDTHRAHAAGPGLGDERKEGISYAPAEVNLKYMNQGIEAFVRQLRDMAPPGTTLWQKIAVQQIGRTGRLESITYHIFGRDSAGKEQVICEATIEVVYRKDGSYKVNLSAENIGSAFSSFV